MSAWPQVDFPKLVKNVLAPQVGKDELSIFGGYCVEQNLKDFIRQWKIKFPFGIWEYTNEIIFKKENLTSWDINVALLERGRLFGEEGDLTLRREGPCFNWFFIGPAGIQVPKGDYNARNYWEENDKKKDAKSKAKKFHQYQEKTLLWGKWDGKGWRESRVAAANLDYPHNGERIQLEYQIFSFAGQVQFVWYTGLSAWEEVGHV